MRSDGAPTGTYRLQLQPQFDFRAAAAACGHIARLGVSHLYLSPILQSAPGSTHGYDVVDHSRLSAALGGADGWRELVAAARAHDLGLVVDIVPNHMAVPAPEWLNRPLWDVLRHGRAAAHAHWFDIDWPAGDDRLVLPFLGDDGVDELRTGSGPTGEPVLRYHEHSFPLADGTERLSGQRLLDAQHYRLVSWRCGDGEVNYRRFFSISSLIAVRVEEEDVFDETHRLILELVAAGDVSGLRVDHPDGLADPAGYLRRLAGRAPGAWLVVEKILEPGEHLPADWPVAGTVGYDSADAVQQVFLDPAAGPALTDVYARFTGVTEEFAAIALRAKREVAERTLLAETRRLARCAGTDDTAPIAQLLASWPVYRTYFRDGERTTQDEWALTTAVERASDDRALYAEWAERIRAGADEFAVRWQQTTGMVMAKGVEDRAFYRYHRLAALCEVGSDPGVAGRPVEDFHAFAHRIATDWPDTMTTLSTHDSKRSEDVRARLLVVAEMAPEWHAAVERWSTRHRIPDANLEYLFWQTLVGAWPIDVERILRYLHKAAREAGTATSWVDPQTGYEAAMDAFCRQVYADDATMSDVVEFVHRIDPAARTVALGSKLVQLTMPGVPDVYQGGERVLRVLVDPDNRGRYEPAPDDGSVKAALTARTLQLRRRHPAGFGAGAGYRPVPATGPAARHVLAFARRDAVTVATRLPVGLAAGGGWRDTSLALPGPAWVDVLTGRHHPAAPAAADVLAELPVALLTPAGG